MQQHTAQCFQCHFQECAELEPETQDFEGGGWRVIPGVILGTSEQLTSSPVTSKMDFVLHVFGRPILGTRAMPLPLHIWHDYFCSHHLYIALAHLSPVIEVSKRGSACSVLDANEHSCKNSWRWLLPMNPALWKKTEILPREGCMYHNVWCLKWHSASDDAS